MALAATSAPAQRVEQEIRVEKFAYQRDVTAVPGAEPVTAGMIGPDGRMGLLNVTGKPFSATETRHTVQMLANGTKIENSDTDLIYRDDLGRTRIEEAINGRTTVVIMDPVARFVAILDRATKTVHKNPIPADAVNGSVSVAQGKVMVRVENIPGGKIAPHVAAVQLGDKEVSGVMATGTRETRTIPAGTIGNDRGLQMVDERWYSADLQVLVKSVNSDPRFGETTYQLVNIVRTMQDPALFQIPADYTVADGPRMNVPGK
jgi:hypothetical protein